MFKIKKHNHGCGLEKAVDFAFTECAEAIKPGQIREEFSKLLIVLDKMKPESVLEIGTGRTGGTLFLFSRAASENATIISVALPGGEFGGCYPKWKIPLFKSFALVNQRIHLIRADSHDEATLEKIKTVFNDKKIDFLFIDGDHTYEGVKRDFQMYSPLVKKEGVIAFHDIVLHPPHMACEVNRFWNEIKSQYEHLEMVKDCNQKCGGIGVIKNREDFLYNS
jgi:predicted O-methyltransferase YrrM